jgi:ABC-2 type transport system permease protein
MTKIWLIIKREYLSRVKKKTFILSTFLTPLLFAGILFTVIMITVKSVSTDKFAVRDSSGFFKDKLKSSKVIEFDFNDSVNNQNFAALGYTGVLYTPQTDINQSDSFKIFSKKNLGVVASERIRDQITNAIENHLLDSLYQINLATLDSVRQQARSAQISNIIMEGDNKTKQGNSQIAYWIGYAAAFLIYITLFIYGTMVMRGVMEEKMNRIAEVMVSSVKPFQLMIGKIVGIGAVGLTQFLMWIVLVFVFSTIINSFIPPEILQQVQEGGNQLPGNNSQANEAIVGLAKAGVKLSGVNLPLIIGCFLFYFLFGYLFYASLFAAVGSAVNEDPQDAQSLMLPVTMPIVFGIIIMMNAIINPTSPMAVWTSIIPFFSPIVMMARLPFGVPGTVAWWELIVSMLSLIGGFLFTTWLSARMYRTGILLYGKKVTWKELIKWAFRSS